MNDPSPILADREELPSSVNEMKALDEIDSQNKTEDIHLKEEEVLRAADEDEGKDDISRNTSVMVASDVKKPESNKSLLVDSGASSPIGNDHSKFIEFQEDFTPDNHLVELADGTVQCFAEKKGTMLIHLRDDQGNLCSLQLKDTLYCPTFPQDIFSVKSATKKGAIVILCDNDSRMIMKNGTVFPIVSKNICWLTGL